MPNPAQLLHARFLTWRGPGNASAASTRGLNGQNWEDHELALRHIKDIDELLRLLESQGRNMRVYRADLPAWYQIVFAFKGGWSGQGTAAIDQRVLDTLEMLAERLEDVVPTLENNGLASIHRWVGCVSGVEMRKVPSELG